MVLVSVYTATGAPRACAREMWMAFLMTLEPHTCEIKVHVCGQSAVRCSHLYICVYYTPIQNPVVAADRQRPSCTHMLNTRNRAVSV